MASPSPWSTSSASSDDSALTFFSQASSTLTQSGLPPVWFDDNRQRNVSFLIHYTDDLEGIVEGVVANSPVQNFDLMDFALTHNFLDDDEVEFVERINLYDPRGRHDDPPLNPLQSWAQNGVNGGDTLTFVPIFKKVELHFKFVFADIKTTRVVVVEITDSLLDALWHLNRISPEMTGLKFGDVKIYYQSNLLNDKPWYAIHDIIDHEKNKPFYNFEVQVCGRGGANRPVTKKHLKKDQAVKELSKRSVDLVKRMYGSPDTAEIGDLPQVLRPVVQPVFDLMTQVRTRMNNNEDIWVEALNHLDDNQLETFKSIFDSDPRNKLKTEVRLYQACSSMVSNLEDIDKYIEHLKKVKLEVISLFIEAYAMKHSEFGRAGAIEYCNTPYFNEITAVINYRNGLRRRAVNAVEDEGDRNENNGGQSCTIM